MTTTSRPKYGTATAITLTTTSLATDTNLIAGRQSTEIDNLSDLALDALIGGTVTVGASPTAGTVVEGWLFGSMDGGTVRGGNAGASDANLTLTQGGKLLLAPLFVIAQVDTTARTYYLNPMSVARAFGGSMPDRWGVFIVHNTGVNMGATALKYRPLQIESV